MSDTCDGRAHELNLLEVTAKLDGLDREIRAELNRLESLMNERHERYRERHESAKEAIATAFQANKDASSKTELAQATYNIQHNDLLRKNDAMIPRPEFDATNKANEQQFAELRKELGALREGGSRGAGYSAGTVAAWGVVVIVMGLIGLGVGLVLQWKH
jgi:hypothetical protein